MYRYRVTDTDGDKVVLAFEFDTLQGFLTMDSSFTQFIAIGEYLPAPAALDKLKHLGVEELADAIEDEGSLDEIAKKGERKTETILATLMPGWADNPKRVRETKGIFLACYNMFLAMKIVMGKDRDAPEVVKSIKGDNLSYLWDIFCFIKSSRDKIDSSFDTSFFDTMEFWVLPVRIYHDLPRTIVRVPMPVMTDLYEDFCHGAETGSLEFDGRALSKEAPIDITDAIKELRDLQRDK